MRELEWWQIASDSVAQVAHRASGAQRHRARQCAIAASADRRELHHGFKRTARCNDRRIADEAKTHVLAGREPSAGKGLRGLVWFGKAFEPVHCIALRGLDMGTRELKWVQFSFYLRPGYLQCQTRTRGQPHCSRSRAAHYRTGRRCRNRPPWTEKAQSS